MKLKFQIITSYILTMWFCWYMGDLPFWQASLFYLIFLFPFVVWFYNATRDIEDESVSEMLMRYCEEKAAQKAKKAAKEAEAVEEATKNAEASKKVEGTKEPQEEEFTLEKLLSEFKDAEVTIVPMDPAGASKVDPEGDAEENSESASDNQSTVVKEYVMRIKVKKKS